MQQTLTLSPPESGQRLDKFVAEAVAGLSRTGAQSLIEQGKITVNGCPSKPSCKLTSGDQVVVRLTLVAPARPSPESIPLDIVYEDEDLIVIDKPAGLVVHPAAGHARGTLVNAALAHYPDLKDVGSQARPGIVHRLDKDTSGLIVIAKNEAAYQALQHQFKARSVVKVYLALVQGQLRPLQGRIEAPIGRDKSQRKRMAVIPGGRQAVTEYKVLDQFDGYTLVEARPHTGRTHQIRVHLAWLKFPLAGDRIYGTRKQRLPLTRHFLHAHTLTLKLPASEQTVTFTSPLAPDLAAVLDQLEQA